jgi:hypothetical protein
MSLLTNSKICWQTVTQTPSTPSGILVPFGNNSPFPPWQSPSSGTPSPLGQPRGGDARTPPAAPLLSAAEPSSPDTAPGNKDVGFASQPTSPFTPQDAGQDNIFPLYKMPSPKDALYSGRLHKAATIEGARVWRPFIAVLTRESFCIGKPPHFLADVIPLEEISDCAPALVAKKTGIHVSSACVRACVRSCVRL